MLSKSVANSNVDVVLVGRVHAQGDRLLISAELVDVTKGWQLWGETYDRWSTAIFEVQDEIAKQISTALRLKLTGEQERRLTRRFTKKCRCVPGLPSRPLPLGQVH